MKFIVMLLLSCVRVYANSISPYGTQDASPQAKLIQQHTYFNTAMQLGIKFSATSNEATLYFKNKQGTCTYEVEDSMILVESLYEDYQYKFKIVKHGIVLMKILCCGGRLTIFKSRILFVPQVF